MAQRISNNFDQFSKPVKDEIFKKEFDFLRSEITPPCVRLSVIESVKKLLNGVDGNKEEAVLGLGNFIDSITLIMEKKYRLKPIKRTLPGNHKIFDLINEQWYGVHIRASDEDERFIIDNDGFLKCPCEDCIKASIEHKKDKKKPCQIEKSEKSSSSVNEFHNQRKKSFLNIDEKRLNLFKNLDEKHPNLNSRSNHNMAKRNQSPPRGNKNGKSFLEKNNQVDEKVKIVKSQSKSSSSRSIDSKIVGRDRKEKQEHHYDFHERSEFREYNDFHMRLMEFGGISSPSSIKKFI
ncbi:hypothetical protein G9A89_003572 [Geosiphon pyriformis]|nr:hypothetical protein G9A89_003572 [Geosiphon pyriformis]